MEQPIPPTATVPQPQPGTPPPSVFQSGRQLVLLRHGLPLPVDRCFRCNGAASATKRNGLLLCGRIGYPKCIDENRIVLAGSGEPYRSTFPPA